MEPTLLLVATLVVLAAVWVLRAVAGSEPDSFIARAIVLGAGAKALASAARYFVAADLYDGRGDFGRYLVEGQRIAGEIRLGVLPAEIRETGTPFMDFIAGVLFSVAPANLFVGFAVFSVLAFTGQVLFLKAFQRAVPTGDDRRYALLVLFVPTVLFWPSSLGKEAWLMFTLGTACYGAARVLRRDRFGYAIVLVAAAGAFAVRPHIAALFALSLAGAFVLRFRDTDVQQRTAGWVIGLVLVGVGAGYAASNFGELLPQDETVQGTQTEQIFAETARRTTTGGSEFDSRPVRNPLDFLHAAVTVPFRPFPNEAPNVQSQVVSLEGLLLLGLVIASAGRLRRLPKYVLSRPYVALATAYSVGFIIAFSNVGNFGLLTRQRAQLLPLLFVLLALPVVQERRRERRASKGPVLTPISAEEQDRLHGPAEPADA